MRNVAGKRGLKQWHVSREAYLLSVCAIRSRRHLRFDLTTSQFYSELMARARASGKAIGTADGYIAATAATNGLAISIRDTSRFEAAGVKVINPWSR